MTEPGPNQAPNCFHYTLLPFESACHRSAPKTEEEETQGVWLPLAEHGVRFGAADALSFIFGAALKAGVTIATLQMRKLRAEKRNQLPGPSHGCMGELDRKQLCLTPKLALHHA